MATVTQIEAEVTANLDRSGISEVSSRVSGWVQAELKEWSQNALVHPPKPVNAREGGRTRLGKPHDWTFLRKTYDFTTVATDDDYTLIAGVLRPIRLWFEASWGDRITYMELEVLKQQYFGHSDGYPEHYGLEFSETITVMPVLWLFPGPSDAWPAHFTYMAAMTAISGVQTNIFTDRWGDGIVAGATGRALRLLRGYDEAMQWDAERTRIMAGAIAWDRGAETEEAMTLGVSTSADGDLEDPRPILNEGYPTGRMIDPSSYY